MKHPKNKFSVLLFGTATLLLVTNIFLILQNLELKSKIEGLEPAKTKKGDVLNTFQAMDLNGNNAKIDFTQTDSKRILLFFKTTCGFCKEQMSYWKSLVSSVDRQKYKITALTTETDAQTIKNYMKDYGIEDWDVLMIKTEDAYKAKFLVTPITVVVGNNGIVERSWIGIWRDSVIEL